MKMNKHYNELKASYLFVDIAHKVAAYQEAHPEKEIIRLGIGDVTQPLAKCVVKAMHDAADEMGTKEGFHGYGPEQGYPFLKQAIQGYYAGRGTQLAEDEIFISDGAKSDLANVLGLFDVDNTVLVPDPVYPTYVDDNVTDGRKIIYSRTSEENGFLGMPDENVKADIIYMDGSKETVNQKALYSGHFRSDPTNQPYYVLTSKYAPVYDYQYYKEHNADLAALFGDNQWKYLEHFVNSGMKEGRQGSSAFNLAAYKANNPDLVAAFGEDNQKYYEHYISSGKSEGRKAS